MADGGEPVVHAPQPFERQDAAGVAGAPLGVFRGGQFVQLVPAADRLGYATRDELADRLGVDRAEFEVLLTCPGHPEVAAVDCLDCWPAEG